MNRLQAMGHMVAILCEGDRLKPGTKKYDIARRLLARKIDTLGPDVALDQVKKWRGHLIDQIDLMALLQGPGRRPPIKGR